MRYKYNIIYFVLTHITYDFITDAEFMCAYQRELVLTIPTDFTRDPPYYDEIIIWQYAACFSNNEVMTILSVLKKG